MKKFIKKHMGWLICLAVLLVATVVIYWLATTEVDRIKPMDDWLDTERANEFMDEVNNAYPLYDVSIIYSEDELHINFYTLHTTISEDDAKALFYRTDEFLNGDGFWDEFYVERDKTFDKYVGTKGLQASTYVTISATDYSDAELVDNETLVFGVLDMYCFVKNTPIDQWIVETAPEGVTIPMP